MFRKLLALMTVVSLGMTLISCASLPGGTNLREVATESGLENVTTGDGTFENYTTTGYYTSLDFGVAIGIPFLVKLIEIFPARSNEDQMIDIGKRAKQEGADAIINATPTRSVYTGIPFMFVGIYVDKTEGTGIKKK